MVDLRDSSFGDGKEAELAAIVSRDATDEELLQALADRYKPFDIEGIGKLVWACSRVRLLADTNDREELFCCNDALRPLIADAASWNKTIFEYATDALLKEKYTSLLKPAYRSLCKQQRMQNTSRDGMTDRDGVIDLTTCSPNMTIEASLPPEN